MEICYWNCKYETYNEVWDGAEETRTYGCSHENNEEGVCKLSNKWVEEEADCHLLDENET